MKEIDALTPTIILVVSSIVNHIYKEKKKFTTADLMLILSPTIPSIIPIFISLFKKMGNFLLECMNFTYLVTFITMVKEWIPIITYFNKSIQEEITTVDTYKPNFIYLIIKCDITFIQLFINYILQMKKCSYDIQFNEYDIMDVNCIYQTQQWNNISIPFHQCNICLKQLTFTYIEKNNKYFIKEFELKTETNVNQYTRFIDFIENKKLKEFVKNLTEAFIQINSKSVEKFNVEKECKTHVDMILLNCLIPTFPNLDKLLFIVDFMIVYTLQNKLYHLGSYITIIKKNKKWFNHNLKPFTSVELPSTHTYTIFIKMDFSQSVSNFNPKFTSDDFSEITNYLTSSAPEIKVNELLFTISSELELPTEQFNNEFKQFIQEVKNVSIDHSIKNNKINIFNTCIEKIEKDVETSNPQYEEYCQRRDEIAKLDKNDESNYIRADFCKMAIPCKTIKHKTIDIKLKNTLINSKYKSLDTLYLRENDMKCLKTMLHNFKNNQEIYEQYGIPNKLGILLYGEPGTGKSSAIQAIASYLQKNIYYASLANVETNDELQMIFNHANSDVGTGIIVFEDIDAMTNIVHSRKKESEHDKYSDKLTLEYFLNLLQGTLTKDGSIVIATTNHLEKLDPAFYRIGRFDVKINMKKCDHYQISQIYEKFVNRSLSQHVLNKLKEDYYTPSDIIFHLIKYINSQQSDVTIMECFIKS